MKELPASPICLRIASSPAHLPIVRAALERFADMIGFDEDTCGKIVLAVDEALTNVIKYAYGGRKDQPIEITLRPIAAAENRRELHIELRDWGVRAEPAKIRSRDLGDVRPGGLGVHIMSSVMDEVQYQPAAEGGTCLRMIKKL